MWLLKTLFLGILALTPALSQENKQGSNPSEANYEFFSGTIADLPEGKITVSRAVLGKAPESRTFVITADTKIEGTLKTEARVTVGFKPGDEGNLAVRIIVRASNPPKRK